MRRSPFISPELFQFFADLKENNEREWFLENKDRYEADVREPLLQFIREFRIRLHSISPHFEANASRVGGSLFRIFRDTRFSADKSPYKTAAGIQFRHKQSKDVHGTGFYLHLEPRNCFAAFGLWKPDSISLSKIRGALMNRPEEWKKVLASPDFASQFELEGDSLKRPPRGCDPNHPLIEDLKRKDFVASQSLTDEETMDPEFIDQYAGICRTGAPFMEFLTRALDLPW